MSSQWTRQQEEKIKEINASTLAQGGTCGTSNKKEAVQVISSRPKKMLLSEYMREQVMPVRSIGIGATTAEHAKVGGGAGVVYTGSRSVWQTAGKPRPYIPTSLALALIASASDSDRTHPFVVFAENAADLESVLVCDKSTTICGIVCGGSGGDLRAADEVGVRSAALSHGIGVVILRSSSAMNLDIVRGIADGRWPAAKVTGNADDLVILPPQYDSKVKIDAVRKAYNLNNEEAAADSNSDAACIGSTKRVITVDSVLEDERRWRAELSNIIAETSTNANTNGTNTAPTPTPTSMPIQSTATSSTSKRSSFFLKMLDQ